MKLYYVRTNAYDMLIADHGDHRHYITDGLGVNSDHENNAMEYLTENAEALEYNSHEWDETEETVEDLTYWQGTEILAEIEV